MRFFFLLLKPPQVIETRMVVSNCDAWISSTWAVGPISSLYKYIIIWSLLEWGRWNSVCFFFFFLLFWCAIAPTPSTTKCNTHGTAARQPAKLINCTRPYLPQVFSCCCCRPRFYFVIQYMCFSWAWEYKSTDEMVSLLHVYSAFKCVLWTQTLRNLRC